MPDLNETTEYFNKTVANLKHKPIVVSKLETKNIERERKKAEDIRVGNIYSLAQN